MRFLSFVNLPCKCANLDFLYNYVALRKYKAGPQFSLQL